MTTLKIAQYEFKLQTRNLGYYLVLLLVTAFLITEVVLNINTKIGTANAATPEIIYNTNQEPLINRTEDYSQALQTHSLGFWAGWLFYDRVTLMLTILFAILAAQVWHRDKNRLMTPLIHSRPLSTSQYFFGKYLGLIFAYLTQLLFFIVVTIVSMFIIAHQTQLSFSIAEFLAPIAIYQLPTLLFSAAFILVISLLIENPIGTTILFLLYWLYSLGRMNPFTTLPNKLFNTLFFPRVDFTFDNSSATLLLANQSAMLQNRLVFLLITALLLVLGAFTYSRKKESHA